MNYIELLLKNKWIAKSINDPSYKNVKANSQLYYQTKNNLKNIRDFFDKAGCRVVDTNNMIKLEKRPVTPTPNMGIQRFKHKEEYIYFCGILIFLEDIIDVKRTTIVLSQITESLEMNLPSAYTDWTVRSNRCRLVTALKYAEDNDLIVLCDGILKNFEDDYNSEVLYYSTGFSRSFTTNMPKNIMNFTCVDDFCKMFENEMSNSYSKGANIKLKKMNNRLLFNTAVYKEDCDEGEFEYLKKYNSKISTELESQLPCTVETYLGSAYLISENQDNAIFPNNNTISDVILLCCKELREKVAKNRFNDEVSIVDENELRDIISNIKKKYNSAFSKEYREKSEKFFINEVIKKMEYLTFIKPIANNKYKVYPSVGRSIGYYPKDFVDSLVEE